MLHVAGLEMLATYTRREKKISLVTLARAAGVNRNTLDVFEKGFTKLVRLLAVLGMELNVTKVKTERRTGKIMQRDKLVDP
jgi:predicted transcriptional regulator